jgi:hypothetical protein
MEDIMSNRPLPGEIYKHFKGNIYRIVTIACHSETGEELVIYQALYGDYRVYARPLAMFMEPVDKEKYPDILQKYRFEKITELVQAPKAEEPAVMTEEGPKMPGDQAESQQNPVVSQVSDDEKLELTTETTDVSSNGEIKIDPMVLEFLDAASYEERLNILAGLHHRITDEMITTMALSVDLEIGDGDVEERYEELKNCLLTFEKYECNRLR